MAQVADLLYQDQFSCAICLDLLKDPVTIPCAHNYCMGCIKGYWDQDDYTGVYRCPQCRETFIPRPVLRKNTMLAEVVDKLKKTGLQAAPPAHCYAGPGDVVCDACTGRKRKAGKSCLVCLVSYCETHLQPHFESPAFKKHKLVTATGNLQDKICSHHDKLLEVYCRTDQQCICYPCVMDKHSGHNTVSAAAERIEKQKQLGATQSKFQQRIQEREKELQDLRQAVQSLKRSAQAAVEDSKRIFTELISSIERRRSEVEGLIRDQEKAEVSRAEGLLEQLEKEIAELRRRDAELEQLSHTEDHIHFLRSFQSLCVPPGPGAIPSIIVSPHSSFEAVRKSVSELNKQLEDVFKVELVKISNSASGSSTVLFSFGAPPQVQLGIKADLLAMYLPRSTAAPVSSAAASGSSTGAFSFGIPLQARPDLQFSQPPMFLPRSTAAPVSSAAGSTAPSASSLTAPVAGGGLSLGGFGSNRGSSGAPLGGSGLFY